MPPPDTILHIGAGRCSELDTWRETGARRIVLVEPNPELLPELRRRTQGVDEVEIIPAAIAPEAGRESLYQFNFPLLASLREPTGLHSMLPGLQQTGRAMVETKHLATLVEELQLDPDGRHRLIIDAPGMESEIVDQLIADDLASIFTAVDITAGREPWYQGSQPLQALIERLEQAGYEPGAVDTGNDPDWPRATFRYSRHAAENRRLAQEVERLQERLRSQNEELSRRFAELSQERDEANAKFESEQKNTRTAAQENEKLQKENKQLTGELKKLKEAASKAEEKAKGENRALADERDSLKKRLEKQEAQTEQFSGLKDLMKNMEKSVRRDVQQSRIQIESYMALNKYLDYGERMPAFHGWTISPDLAIKLVEMLETEQYDLIIEFGSGSSTVLMGQVVQQQMSQVPRIGQLISRFGLTDQSNGDSGSQQLTPSSGGHGRVLPARILAFEHNRKYLTQTQTQLQQAGVDHLVNLVYAPLQEFSFNDQKYLYYDCDGPLEQASRLVQKDRAKILVLVDGPPGKTNRNARYPAMPFLLRWFGSHQLHIVLDDHDRKEEEEIMEIWEQELECREIASEKELWPVEKGACIIRFK